VHGKYYAFNISDPKPRNIHKATVRDRLLHHAIYRVLYPYFDTKFVHDSYSCRKDKGTHKALERFKYFSGKVSKNNTKTCWVLKCDIRKFFASINHEILKSVLAKHIGDREVLDLMDRIIDSFHTLNGEDYNFERLVEQNTIKKSEVFCDPRTEKLNSRNSKFAMGLPLGNLTSQLLVNIYMNEFDQWMKHTVKAKYYIRYADDFIIMSPNKDYLLQLIPKISDFLKENLKLDLHPKKLFLKTLASGLDFLGWVHFSKHRVLRTATKKRMFRNLEAKKEGDNIESIKASYVGMLKHGNAYRLSKTI
jgi:retron-type reverse transcriptase